MLKNNMEVLQIILRWIDSLNKKIGCLVIHGFGGNTKEVLPLAEHLDSQGFVTVCPELKGHTGNRRDLARATYGEWIGSAEEGMEQLKIRCGRIVLVGFSMGGLIAANLAVKNDVDAVVTLNMPIYYWDLNRVITNIRDDLKNGKADSLKHYIRSAFDKPLSSLINFRLLLQKTKALLKEIKCPIFITQALEDDAVKYKSANYIYENVSSSKKKVKLYEGSGHMICHSRAADRVFDDISKYIISI